MVRGLKGLVAGLCGLALLTAAPARAERVVNIETKAGFGFAKFTGDVSGAENKTGFVGGIDLEWALTPTLSLEPELFYAMKGTSFGTVTDPTIDGITYTGTFNQIYAVDYLEMPVILRAKFGQGAVRPTLAGGPYLGWKVLEKVHLNGSGSNDFMGKNDAVRAFDLGYSGGLGVELGPAKGCVTLEARYSGSFMNIQKPEFSGQVKNSDMRVMVGWKQEWPKPLGGF